MRATSLPPVWAHLASRLHYVQQVSNSEWSAECIKCGGAPHASGEWPDRMRIFADEKPLLWCRRCGMIQYPDNDERCQLSPEAVEKWRLDRVRSEEERKRSAERALATLQASRVWEQYHAGLGKAGRAYWQARGIPETLQDYWQLGYIDEFVIHHQGESYLGASATIPLFGAGWQPINIKHRVLHAPTGVGKYRYELSGQPQPMFLTDPDDPLDGVVYAIEGEIKAMVTWLTLDDRSCTMVGLPGCNPSAAIVATLAQAERVILVLDPGAEEAAFKMAGTIGTRKCRVLIPPMKIDDAILLLKPSKRELLNLLNASTLVVG